jgi:transposase-like protein
MQQRAEVTPKPERIKTAAEYLQSGKTMAAWSKEREINRFTLHNWVNEYRQELVAAVQSGGWLEVSVETTKERTDAEKAAVTKPETEICTPIRITIGNTQVEVTTSFDEKALAAVIKAVKSQCWN